jgi:hypothetical protein
MQKEKTEMYARNKFKMRVLIPEESLGDDVLRILRGWSQVIAFGRATFSRRVSPDEASRVVTALNLLEVKYDLWIGKEASAHYVASLLMLAGSHGAPVEQEEPQNEECRLMIDDFRFQNSKSRAQGEECRSMSNSSIEEEREAAEIRRLSRVTVLRFCAAVLPLFLATVLIATNIMGKKQSSPAYVGSIGIYEDDFSDNRYGWTCNGTAEVASGAYTIGSRGSDRAVLIANERLTGSNMIAETSVGLHGEGQDGFAGLAFRVHNSENFYFFGVTRDGRAAILKRELGYWRRLSPGGGIVQCRDKRSSRPEHRLRIVSKGVYTEFYLDGELLTVARDESFQVGSFGFYVDKGVSATFDDLLVAFDGEEQSGASNTLALK